MIYPGKYGGNPSTGSRDNMGTRICHAKAEADADTDTNGIGIETNYVPPHLWWWDINMSKGFDVTEWTRVCGRNGNFQSSKGNNSKNMQSRVMVPGSARLLMTLNICVKFHENILNGFEVTERTRVCCKN